LNNYTIIPSQLRYIGAPAVDEEISITLEEQSAQITEFDRSQTVSLAQVFDDERQACTVFRPTFKATYIYGNTYTGTTTYLPFQYNLYYVNALQSTSSGTWVGLPQYYEFDFFRPDVSDQHIAYKAKSAYTYNWTYYISYAYKNNYDSKLSATLNNSNFNWIASDGIPFSINNYTKNGSGLISFQCISPHGLTPGEYVELSIYYGKINIFQVDSLGNGLTESDEYIFNIYNVGYTGNTFANNVTGTFKRIINPDNILETKSKYYVREHKVLTNVDDVIVTRAGFEKNVFNELKKFEFSSLTPNNVSRVSQLTSSNAYDFTVNYDLDLKNILDNQKRPVSELFLTVINKGYTGYFNQPYNGIGLKQGWKFNLNKKSSTWWDQNNIDSNTNISVSSYTKSNRIFYFNLDLKRDDVLDGDFCEWNDYEQIERVVSPYYQKIKYNQDIFQTTSPISTNSPGFYYTPHNSMTIRVFSDYIETADANSVDNVPSYSFYSKSDEQFRWRDLYTYGFIDNLGRGVNYPFFNSAQYPFKDFVFRLIPEGINFNSNLLGVNQSIKPLIDECE